MNFVINTYVTISGIKKVVELCNKNHHQKLIYQDNKPTYFVDFYDLQKESNAMMNILVLCTGDSIDKVLKNINKRYSINLSIPIISRIGFQKKIKSEIINLDLNPIPLKWLGYSL
jgi:hypothetical protein|tara:strand:- start:584 stop:928 length:345 start_codon:yes stop_codon:yes gene_type:complete